MLISIHEIMGKSIQDVIDEFHERKEEFQIQFDDGILACDGCMIVWDRFIWEYYIHLPVRIPALMKYSLAGGKVKFLSLIHI